MIPSAGTPITISDILLSILKKTDLGDSLKRLLDAKHTYLVNSGTTAFYIILSALKKLSGKEEIILPAYTAPSLILPIKKAGLKYRLVDVSLETFNMDIDKTIEAISENTLAVLCIHMYGLPADIEKILENKNGAYVVEDAASSFGTRKDCRFTGTFGDIGFISFNRGKNLSTVAGGLIATDAPALAAATKEEIKQLQYPGISTRIKMYFKAVGLSYAVRPWFYSILRRFVSKFKYTELHQDFESYQYTRFQESLGGLLLNRNEKIFNKIEDNGLFLINGLKDIDGIIIPRLPDGWRVVFNQFPLLVEDEKRRDIVFENIIKTGVEATKLYDKPIHRIYNNLTNGNDPFPNATYMSKRLILIPTHPYIEEKDMDKVIKSIKESL